MTSLLALLVLLATQAPTLTHAAATPEPPVTLTVTGEVACKSFIGFGAEDDGYIYNDNNVRRGVGAADFALREGRIRWLRPSYVRMFSWYRDWNPSLDRKTFVWDGDDLRSQYRTLDLYQRLGTRVNIVMADWAVPNLWDDPPALARALGALMEHLIVTKGYTCIKDWTLANEPDGLVAQGRGDYKHYAELHRLAREEFRRRGLKLSIVGSDDTGNLAWFKQCAGDAAYSKTVDLFSSHKYFQLAELASVPGFFRERLKLLAAKASVKPLVMEEMGFGDARMVPPNINPLMDEYRYAILTQSACIEGLNQGVAGFCIWCLHAVYYIQDEEPMQFGLWAYKDKGWAVRPVYHAVAAMSRFARPGRPVLRCVSSRPERIKAAAVGPALFWVNPSGRSATVQLKGFKARKVCVMTEATLKGDRDCGTIIEHPKENQFPAPPLSFGYALAQ